MKYYDATQEFKPFAKREAASNRHPNKCQASKHPVSGKYGHKGVPRG